MLTKSQKTEQVEEAKKLIGASQNLVFADFTGIPTQKIKKLKGDLKVAGATYKVFKKRLMKIALEGAGFAYDPTQFSAQVGIIAIPKDLSSAAAVIYKFTKEMAKVKKEFKVLGAYDLVAKTALTAEEFTVIAKLPSREALLAQVLGAFTGPVRAFMYLLQERAKKMVEVR